MTNYPPGIRERLLLSQDGSKARREMQTIASRFAKVLAKGQAAETAGKVDAALAHYAAMAEEMFEGTFPYERLRIIYAGQKRYADAAAACRAFITMLDTMRAAGAVSVNETKRQKFNDWAAKYSSKG